MQFGCCSEIRYTQTWLSNDPVNLCAEQHWHWQIFPLGGGRGDGAYYPICVQSPFNGNKICQLCLRTLLTAASLAVVENAATNPALTSKLRMVPNMGLVAKERDVWGCHNSVCGCRIQLGTTPPTPGSSIRTNYTRWSWNCFHFNVEIILNLSFAFVWAYALYFQLLIGIPFTRTCSK
jgi:hypothetical protein